MTHFTGGWGEVHAFLRAAAFSKSSPRLGVADLGHALWRLTLIGMRPRRHAALLSLLKQDEIAPIRACQPQLPFKYLRRNYLAANLGRAGRAAVLSHHYAYVASRWRPELLRELTKDGVRLWRHDGPAMEHEIRLALAHPVDNEGEFALTYRVDATEIGVLSFSVAPPALFGLEGDGVPLVSRIQMLDDPPLLRAATKDQHDIAPRFVLASALQGLAAGSGFDTIMAVSRCNQVAFRTDREALSPETYDGLYLALSGRPGPPGFFRLDVPFAEKDLALIAPTHRRRTKRKRAARRAIVDTVERAAAALRRPGAAQNGLRPPCSPSE